MSDIKRDYSEFLTRERFAIEDDLWRSQGRHAEFAGAVIARYPTDRKPRVLEIGCGPGWLVPHLGDVAYLGVDANQICVDAANSRYPGHQFTRCDIRSWKPEDGALFDIVCAVAVTKHFPLSEWRYIVARILSLAPVAVFSQPFAMHSFDNGVDFPHVFVSEKELREAVGIAEHELIEPFLYLSGGEVEPIITTVRRQHD